MNESPSTLEAISENRPTRRDFLRTSAIGLALPIAGGALSVCSTAEPRSDALGATAASQQPGAHAAAPAAAAARTPEVIRAMADEMDAMHEKGMRSFPAPTEGKGNQSIEPRIENGIKVFDLETTVVQWEVEPGRRVEAWSYNGQVPGPQIRVREGDRVRINLKNNLEQSTSIHFHGLEVPNDQDGVPFITQPPVKPGESYTYEFTVPNPGSHMYHSHHNSAKQVGMGLLGAFLVEPRSPRPEERADVDYTMILNDGFHGYTLNGKGFPATEPVMAKRGQRVRIRFLNEGMMLHPMHLHGMHMTVIEKDGWPQPRPWKCDTINIAPGERWDVIVEATNPGTWAFHCHILPHAESAHGMFGMMTAMIVE